MLEVLNSLGIKPMQILIQLVGFLLVFGLMAKLLWKPILDLMDSREKEVSDMFARAEEAQRKSEEVEADYKKRMAEIDVELQKKQAEGIKKGSEMAEQIVAEAREQAEQEKQKALNTIRDEAQKARMGLRDFAVDLSMKIAGKVLEEDVDQKKHEGIVKKFLNELESMN